MIIEVDEYKKKVKGYSSKRSEDFHKESAMLADKDFCAHLKTKKYKKVILMAGGTASGKTEYARSYLLSKTALVYDGTLKNFSGLKPKLDKIERYSKHIKNIRVVFIIPKNIEYAFAAFLKRERKMHERIFFETHIKSRESLAKILMQTKIKVEIYASEYDEKTGKLSFVRIKLNKGRSFIGKLIISTARVLRGVAEKRGFDISNEA
jgi:hypothetical protein